MRPWSHILVAGATVVVLGAARHGFEMPALLILVVAGGAISACLAVGISAAAWCDSWVGLSDRTLTWRTAAAALWCVGTIGWAGPLALAKPIAAFQVGLVVLLFAPLVTAVLAGRHEMWFGISTATCCVVSLVASFITRMPIGYVFDWRPFALLWAIGIMLACSTALAVRVRRGRPTTR
jgi:hypothetical protein